MNPACHRVGLQVVRDDGNCRARRLNGPYRRRAHRDDDVHLFLYQLGRQARKPGGIAVGDARHELDLLSFAAGATQSCENNLDTGRASATVRDRGTRSWQPSPIVARAPRAANLPPRRRAAR